MSILSFFFGPSKATIAADNAAYERKLIRSKDPVLLRAAFVEAADAVENTLLSAQSIGGNVAYFVWSVQSQRIPDFTVRVTLGILRFGIFQEGSMIIIIRDPGAVARVSAALRELDPSRYVDPTYWATVGTVVDDEALRADVYQRGDVTIVIRGYTIPLTVEQKVTA